MIQIQSAQMGDAQAIMEVNVAAFNDEIQRVWGRDGGPPGYDDIEEHQRLIREHHVYVLKEAEQVIGSFFLVDEGDEVRLESFCILPERQGQGYGKCALQWMEKAHPQYRCWNLSSMKESMRIWTMYEKFGYQRVGESEYMFDYQKVIRE